MSFRISRIEMDFLRIRAICFLFSLIFSIFILTLSSIEYGRTYRFIVVFYVIGKILKAIFAGFSKSDYHHDR